MWKWNAPRRLRQSGSNLPWCAVLNGSTSTSISPNGRLYNSAKDPAHSPSQSQDGTPSAPKISCAIARDSWFDFPLATRDLYCSTPDAFEALCRATAEGTRESSAKDRGRRQYTSRSKRKEQWRFQNSPSSKVTSCTLSIHSFSTWSTSAPIFP